MDAQHIREKLVQPPASNIDWGHLVDLNLSMILDLNLCFVKIPILDNKKVYVLVKLA